MTELELVSTPDLIAELEKRYDASLIVFTTRVTVGKSEQELYFHGGYIHAIGLASYIHDYLLRKYGRPENT